jgi:hypothetical protein
MTFFDDRSELTRLRKVVSTTPKKSKSEQQQPAARRQVEAPLAAEHGDIPRSAKQFLRKVSLADRPRVR